MEKKLAAILLITTLSTTTNNFHVEFDVGIQNRSSLGYKIKNFALDTKYTLKKYLYKLKNSIGTFFSEPNNPTIDTILTIAFVAFLYYAISRYGNYEKDNTHNSDLEETYKRLTKAIKEKKSDSIKKRLKAIEKNIETIQEEMQSFK